MNRDWKGFFCEVNFHYVIGDADWFLPLCAVGFRTFICSFNRIISFFAVVFCSDGKSLLCLRARHLMHCATKIGLWLSVDRRCGSSHPVPCQRNRSYHISLANPLQLRPPQFKPRSDSIAANLPLQFQDLSRLSKYISALCAIEETLKMNANYPISKIHRWHAGSHKRSPDF